MSAGHHPLSHHQGDEAKVAQLSKVNTFHMQMFAHLMDRLAEMRDGDGTLT